MTPKKATNDYTQIEQFAGWAKVSEKLDKAKQEEVKAVTCEVWKLQETLGETELSLGERLTKLNTLLSPLRIFVAYVDEFFHMSRATAYRYMDQYKAGKKFLPEPILEAAIARGTVIKEEVLEKFVSENPPPTSHEPKVIQEYITKFENIPTTPIKVVTDPELLEKEIVNFSRLRFERLDLTAQAKAKWGRRVLSLLATVFAIKDQVMITPMVLPEGYVAKVGRPKEEKQEKQAA